MTRIDVRCLECGTIKTVGSLDYESPECKVKTDGHGIIEVAGWCNEHVPFDPDELHAAERTLQEHSTIRPVGGCEACQRATILRDRQLAARARQ